MSDQEFPKGIGRDRPVAPDPVLPSLEWVGTTQRGPSYRARAWLRPSPEQIVIDVAPIGSSWAGWRPVDDGLSAVDAGPDPSRSENISGAAGRMLGSAEPAGGAVSLTREHLEQWIERLRALQAHDRSTGTAQIGPGRWPHGIPQADIVEVGRRPTSSAKSNGEGFEQDGPPAAALARVARKARAGEGAWRPGSRQRVLVLTLILVASLIWTAQTLGRFAPRSIEVPSTLNDRFRIV